MRRVPMPAVSKGMAQLRGHFRIATAPNPIAREIEASLYPLISETDPCT